MFLEKAGPLTEPLLEIGTGKGYLALALAQKGHRFTGVDISGEDLALARLNLRYYGLADRVDLLVADAGKLDFPDASYVSIVCANVIHHLAVKEAEKVAREMVRLLCPGGRIVVSDFNREGLELMARLHAVEGRKHCPGPFTLEDFAGCLAGSGLSLTRHQGGLQSIVIAEKPAERSRMRTIPDISR